MIFDRLPSSAPQRGFLASGYEVFNALIGSMTGASGVVVNSTTAMRSSAVYACVRVLAETLAQLPIHVYERRPDGSKRLAVEHPLNRILQIEPNQWQTGCEFFEMMMGHLALRGNAYAEIVPGGPLGAVGQLVPIHPDCVRIERLSSGRLRYQIRQPSGTELPYTQDEIMHIRGLSMDGVCGLSPIDLMRDPIGLAKAAEIYGSKFFANSARPDGILSTDAPNMSEQTARQNREAWQRVHGGADNSHRVAVLAGGLKWQAIGMTNENGQFLESRRFQNEEIARAFRVPPHMIADLERSTNNNIEHQGLEFVKFTMAPWLKRWESAIQRDLITDDRYYVKFNFDGLQRGDSASRAAFYTAGVNGGWLLINEARELEDMDPVEGGDVPLVQGAMITLDRAINPPEPPKPEAPQPDPAAEAKAAEEKAAMVSEIESLRTRNETLAFRCQDKSEENVRLSGELGAAKAEAILQTAQTESVRKQSEQERLRGDALQASVDSFTKINNQLWDDVRKAAEDNAKLSTEILVLRGAQSESASLAREMLGLHVGLLIKREVGRLEKAATKPESFLDSVETLYLDHEPRLQQAIDGPLRLLSIVTGAERDSGKLAAAYVQASKDAILEAAGRFTSDTLSAGIAELTADWGKRAETILESEAN